MTAGLGRPLLFFLTAGNASDYQGARHLLDRLPKARELLADRGYDADWFRNWEGDFPLHSATQEAPYVDGHFFPEPLPPSKVG